GLVRRHADHAEERCQGDRRVAVARSDARVRIDLPSEELAVAERDAPVPRPHLVDADGERLPGSCAAHTDGPVEGVPGVEPLLIALVQELALEIPMPAGVERAEADGIARLDLEDRRHLTREVSVQRAPLERELVDHVRGVPTQASLGASRTRSPARRPSSRNSTNDT